MIFYQISRTCTHQIGWAEELYEEDCPSARDVVGKMIRMARLQMNWGRIAQAGFESGG